MVEPVETSVVDLARAGLLEITPVATIGELLSQSTDDEGVTTVLFASAMLGYPDWHWTVSLAALPGEQPTVLEAELLPGDGSLLAPDWVPWADRLEDYKAAQAAIAAGELAAGGDEDDSDEDDSDDDDHGDDDLGDDPDDGIDFESDESLAQLEAEALDEPDGDDPDDELSAVPATVGVDEQDEPDAEPDEDRPEPPAVPLRKQRAKKQQ